MKKEELRKFYKAKRKALKKEIRDSYDESLITSLQKFDWTKCSYLHVFMPIARHSEPNISTFYSWVKANFPNIKLVISKTEIERGKMINYHWDDIIIIEENQWGILEPNEGTIIDEKLIDVVLVPLLVADKKGHRVGYGKGFYDRFLAKCRKDVATIGISYFPLIEAIQDVGDWDIPLNYCITPEGFEKYTN